MFTFQHFFPLVSLSSKINQILITTRTLRALLISRGSLFSNQGQPTTVNHHQRMFSTTNHLRLQLPLRLIHRSHSSINPPIAVFTAQFPSPSSSSPSLSLSDPRSRYLGFSARRHQCGGSRNVVVKCDDSNDALQPDSIVIPQEAKSDLADILSKANSYLPHIVLASTLLALIYPPSFTWFTNRYYAPALGFLMFAVGLNSNEKDFVEAFKRPTVILAGYVGQFVVKPLLGFLFGTIAVTVFGLPSPVGAGIMLTSCVSGAQLSNYATFLTDPQMAPLSIVMTSLSTASATFVTPLLSLLLIGKRLPVDVKGMMASITQIVVAPIVMGLLLNRLLPGVSKAIRPFLPPLSVFVTSLCVGAPLAININAVMSPFGLIILLLIIAFHLSAFIAGYVMSGLAFGEASDAKALQRTISYETGMQSSLLGLALANKFFEDPVVGVPPAISTVIMSLMGFSLVMLWAKKKEQPFGKQVE